MFRINAGLVREEIFRRDLSLRQFAIQAGLNPFTARKIIQDGATVTSRTIATLARFFNTSGDSLILKKG